MRSRDGDIDKCCCHLRGRGSMDPAGRQEGRGVGEAISGQGQFEVECDQGGDKSWTRGSWSTHMGLMRGCHLSYNLLNKADPSPPCTQLLIVYSTSLLFCPTPQPFLSLSLSLFLSLCPVHQLLQRRADRHNAEKIGCNPCKIAFCGFPLICAQICCFFACYLSCLWQGDAS